MKRQDGYDQLILNKKNLLACYDIALIRSKTHKVQTSHGNVVEAEFRKWLSNFLPKKYGVTSGYIISQSMDVRMENLSHYDVIIYDALECPIFDVEANQDESNQGLRRVIPAEHIHMVIEVKSTLTYKSITDANKKLQELEPLLFNSEVDELGPYNGKLKPNFVTQSLFFELKESEFKKEQIFRTLFEHNLSRHFGSIILRAQGKDDSLTGITKSIAGDSKVPMMFNGLDSGFTIYADVVKDDKYHGGVLNWSNINFSDFALNTLNLLNCTYRQGFAPSLYGLNLPYIADDDKTSNNI